MHHLLELDKTSPDSIAAMLAVGAFRVVSQHETKAEAERACCLALIRNVRNQSRLHYELCDEKGVVLNWDGVYANREVLAGKLPSLAIDRPSELNPAYFRQVREWMGLSQTEFGHYLGGSALRTVQDWESEKRHIPSTVAEILRLKGWLSV